ncbi:MAG: HEAT repeat domain-containing protein [Woeseiaceae bacterium]|nr:HEAT repeat domain-containing protein [Woeseiaceae bacterium]
MPDWLFNSGFSAAGRIALWTVVGVAVTTVVLFAYTMALRLALIRNGRRRNRLHEVWRPVFSGAMLDRNTAWHAVLPKFRRRDRILLLDIWNQLRHSVVGPAADNLIVIAQRAGLDRVAGELFHSRDAREKLLAIQSLGYLRDDDYKDVMIALIDSEETIVSITAALALVEIDADVAVRHVVPKIVRRRDWPKVQLSDFLRSAGGERIGEPMYRALRNASDEDTVYLLQFAGLIEAEVLEALVVELIRESRHPGVLNAALKLVNGFDGVPRLASLTRHDEWYVRVQAAKVIGRLGEPEHVSLLESMLEDAEWWVRYRAAQSLVSLPFLGPNRLRELQRRQTDRYAAEILDQAFAEVGLA